MNTTTHTRRAIRPLTMGLLTTSLLLAGCGAGSPTLRDAGGRLQPCDAGPHCVSSEATEADLRVEPFRHDGDADAALAKLAAVIEAMDGGKVVTRGPDYLHASFTTALMKYVDDVEFVATATQPGVLQVRSSSRIGYYDFGANRKRVDAIRAAFAAKAG